MRCSRFLWVCRTNVSCSSVFWNYSIILALNSQYDSVNVSLSSSCCCVSSSSLHSNWSCTVLYSSHAFSNNYSQTLTSHMSTVSCKLSMYFSMCAILALTAVIFLTNDLRVWESIVLRIGKERANLPIYVLLWHKVNSTYAGNCAARKLSIALLTLSLTVMLCCDLLARSYFACDS